IRRFRLHLHNQRGLALTSSYAAIRVLDPSDTVFFDTTLGGVGGCPYCGNGRAAGMAATEDFVQLLEMLGIPTGVNPDRLVEAVALASEIIGGPLDGHVSKAGPFPRGGQLYSTAMPVIETHEQALHFQRGPAVYAGQPRPWDEERSRSEQGTPETR